MSKDSSTCDGCYESISEYDLNPLAILSAQETKDAPKCIEELSVCEGCLECFTAILVKAENAYENWSKYDYYETKAYHEMREKDAKQEVWRALDQVLKVQKKQSEFRAIPNDKKRKLPEAEAPKAKKAKTTGNKKKE